MATYPKDIYTEPSRVDVHTLSNLGPLTGMAGIWEGRRTLDIPPKPPAAPEQQPFVEHTELQPIDPQANGPQLFYGLRYHTHIVKPGEVETYHDQVGYWLWEPATDNLIQTLTIPRGQTVMAFGHAVKDATSFELVATRGALTNGICSNPFLEYAFQTVEYRINVTIGPRRHVGLRREYNSDCARPIGAVSSHRSQRPDENRRADTQSAGSRLTGRRRKSRSGIGSYIA